MFSFCGFYCITLESITKSNVFFSYDWSPVTKMKMYLINFSRAYMGDHRKIPRSTDFCTKTQCLSTGDHLNKKNHLFFCSFAGVGLGWGGGGGGGGRSGGTSISDQSRTCLHLGSPFQQKFQNRVYNLGQNAKPGISKASHFPERVKFILKALLVVKQVTLCIDFSRTGGCVFSKTFSRTGSKNFLR